MELNASRNFDGKHGSPPVPKDPNHQRTHRKKPASVTDDNEMVTAARKHGDSSNEGKGLVQSRVEIFRSSVFPAATNTSKKTCVKDNNTRENSQQSNPKKHANGDKADKKGDSNKDGEKDVPPLVIRKDEPTERVVTKSINQAPTFGTNQDNGKGDICPSIERTKQKEGQGESPKKTDDPTQIKSRLLGSFRS